MNPIEQTSTFQKAIEIVETLSIDAQAMLVEIIQKRLKQKRRDELILAVEDARAEYARGEVQIGTIFDLMGELDY